MVKFLIVGQHTAIENAVTANRKEIVPGKYVRAENSQRFQYIPPVYEFSKTFEELCEQFPNAVTESDKLNPSWGSAWFKADENGNAVLAAENWDTSD